MSKNKTSILILSSFLALSAFGSNHAFAKKKPATQPTAQQRKDACRALPGLRMNLSAAQGMYLRFSALPNDDRNKQDAQMFQQMATVARGNLAYALGVCTGG